MRDKDSDLLLEMYSASQKHMEQSIDDDDFLYTLEVMIDVIELFLSAFSSQPKKNIHTSKDMNPIPAMDALKQLKAEISRISLALNDKDHEILHLKRKVVTLQEEQIQQRKIIVSLEHRTSQLKQQNLDLMRRLAKTQKKADKAADQLSSTQKTSKQTKAQLLKKIEGLNQTIQKLEGGQELESKKKQLDHSNTSQPSSQNPNHTGVFPGRKKSGKHKGCQKGHKGAGRKHFEADKYDFLPDPKQVTEHPEDWTLTNQKIHNMTDACFWVVTLGLIQNEWRNIHTGQIVKTPYPAGLGNEDNYGPNLKALVFILTILDNVSFSKTSQLLNWMSDGKLKISTGWINSLAGVFAERTEEDRKEILRSLMAGPYMAQDFSHIKIGRSRTYASIYTNPDSVLVQLKSCKGYKGLMGGPLKIDTVYKGEHLQQPGYDGPVVGDHDLTFKGVTDKKQECLIHINRHLKKALLFDPKAVWAKQMLKLIRKMTKDAKYGIAQDPAKVQEFKDEYAAILKEAQAYYGPDRYGKQSIRHEGWKLYRRMQKKPGDYLRFLDNPLIPYHNQGCELIARQIKRRHKTIDGFRGAAGADNYFKDLSVLETAKKRNLNVFDLVKSVFEEDQIY